MEEHKYIECEFTGLIEFHDDEDTMYPKYSNYIHLEKIKPCDKEEFKDDIMEAYGDIMEYAMNRLERVGRKLSVKDKWCKGD